MSLTSNNVRRVRSCSILDKGLAVSSENSCISLGPLGSSVSSGVAPYTERPSRAFWRVSNCDWTSAGDIPATLTDEGRVVCESPVVACASPTDEPLSSTAAQRIHLHAHPLVREAGNSTDREACGRCASPIPPIPRRPSTAEGIQAFIAHSFVPLTRQSENRGDSGHLQPRVRKRRDTSWLRGTSAATIVLYSRVRKPYVLQHPRSLSRVFLRLITIPTLLILAMAPRLPDPPERNRMILPTPPLSDRSEEDLHAKSVKTVNCRTSRTQGALDRPAGIV